MIGDCGTLPRSSRGPIRLNVSIRLVVDVDRGLQDFFQDGVLDLLKKAVCDGHLLEEDCLGKESGEHMVK